jgi:hypothetical protein
LAHSPDGLYYDENHVRGEANIKHVLTDEKVKVARWMYLHQGYGMDFIVAVIGKVSIQALSRAITKDTWRHVSTPLAQWIPPEPYREKIKGLLPGWGIRAWQMKYRRLHIEYAPKTRKATVMPRVNKPKKPRGTTPPPPTKCGASVIIGICNR